MACSFQNQYVLLHFGDTGKYLQYGFEWTHQGKMFAAGYGLFTLVASLKYSLWFVVFFQSVLGAVVLRTSFNRLLGQIHPWLNTGFIGFLCWATSLSRLSSTVMPDFFVPLACLCLFLLLTARTTPQVWSAGAGVALLGTMHTSMWVVYVFVAFVLALVVKRPLRSAAWWRVVGFAMAVFPLTFTWNWFLGKDFYLSKLGPVMTVARMAKTGVLDHYLARHCPDGAHPAFCERQGQYTQDHDFIFNAERSPLFKISPGVSWDDTWTDPAVQAELRRIIRGVAADPVLYPHVVLAALTGWWQTTVYMNYVADTDPFELFFKQTAQFVPADRLDYVNSLQARRLWSVEYDAGIMGRYSTSVVLALLVLAFMLARRKPWPAHYQTAFVVVVTFIVAHGFVCGVFSGPHPRYADRVNWLLVMLGLAGFWTVAHPLWARLQKLG